jgi:hypothetical protein
MPLRGEDATPKRARGRGVQFRQSAVLHHANTPSLRMPGFEDDDEAPHQFLTITNR